MTQRGLQGERTDVRRREGPEETDRRIARWAREVRDVPELVRDEHVAPDPELADVLARIRWGRPQIDRRLIEHRPCRSIRDLVWIVDDDLRLVRRSIADEGGDRGINGFDARGGAQRPGFELRRIMKCEMRRFDGATGKPRTHVELRVCAPSRTEPQCKRKEAGE